MDVTCWDWRKVGGNWQRISLTFEEFDALYLATNPRWKEQCADTLSNSIGVPVTLTHRPRGPVGEGLNFPEGIQAETGPVALPWTVGRVTIPAPFVETDGIWLASTNA